jgi:hypothetical protein
MRVASSASVAQSDICVDSGRSRLSRVEIDAWYRDWRSNTRIVTTHYLTETTSNVQSTKCLSSPLANKEEAVGDHNNYNVVSRIEHGNDDEQVSKVIYLPSVVLNRT